jgi:hypothetical protein
LNYGDGAAGCREGFHGNRGLACLGTGFAGVVSGVSG